MSLMLTAMAGALLVAPPALGASGDGAGAETTTHSEDPALHGGNDTGGCANGEHEFKIEGTQDSNTSDADLNSGTYTDPATGTRFEIMVYSTTSGAVFDFRVSGGSAAEVRAKGGPDHNSFNYFVHEDPDGDDPANGTTAGSDTRLHSPEQATDKWYGLSHVTFCYDTGTEIRIVKTALDDSITIGDAFSYDITVSDVADGIDALNVTVIDPLLPDGFDWNVVSQSGSACSIADGDTDGNADDLTCAIGTLADGTSYSVRVATTTAATADHCDQTSTNVAAASADNADTVTDDAPITVLCGGLQVVKTAKHKDTSGNTSADLGATFEIVDSNGAVQTVTTDSGTGLACVDDLPLGDSSVRELSGPSGYALDTDTVTVAVTDADCGTSGVATASFENIPLTDISWSVDSQRQGATLTVVTCYDGAGNVLPGYPVSVSDGSGTLPNLLPTDPDVTVSCAFVVDP